MEISSEHNTFGAADTAETVTVKADAGRTLTVTNRSGTNPIYFRFDGTTAVKAANGTLMVPGSSGATKSVELVSSDATLDVSLICLTAEDYSVEVH